MLLVAGLASASAQTGGMKSADNFYVKGSVGLAKPQSDGGLTKLTKGLTAMSGLDLELDSSVAFSFEGGMYYGENFSFGLEWTMFNSDAKAGKDFAGATNIAALNAALGLTSGGDIGTGGVTTFEEKINSDRFMFVFNYEHYFNDQFSLLVNTGLGVLNVEQKIKVFSPAAVKIDSKADDTVFAYQIGLSLGYHFNEDISIYGGGRYLAASDIDFDHKSLKLKDFNPDVLVYEVGVRYSF